MNGGKMIDVDWLISCGLYPTASVVETITQRTNGIILKMMITCRFTSPEWSPVQTQTGKCQEQELHVKRAGKSLLFTKQWIKLCAFMVDISGGPIFHCSTVLYKN